MQLPYINKIVAGPEVADLEAEGLRSKRSHLHPGATRQRGRGMEVEIISGDKDLLPWCRKG